ncbi:MAG: hypothetical protein Q8P41_10855 [Pseudomonadota bacterium]|nr:hypothetical protein [Pseudomonadota bacterium]
MLFLVLAAHAYETDQVTSRLVPLADAAAVADAELDRLLAEAVRRTNEATGCGKPVRATRARLATEINRATSPATVVAGREGLAAIGHGLYAAWLETAPEVARRTFRDRDDIYGDLTPRDSFVLGWAGVCSTVNLGGVLLGTDKTDHFLDQGYDYFLRSREGRNDARAIRWGTRTELSAYGLLTSNAFSWADLYANWQGYTFYKTLLEAGSAFQRDEEGCVAQTRPWRWAEWLDDAADEAINPPVYTPDVGHAVRLRFQEHRSAVCAEYAAWGPAVAARRVEIAARERAHVTDQAPPRVDEWGLDELCAPEIEAARVPARPAPARGAPVRGASAEGVPVPR